MAPVTPRVLCFGEVLWDCLPDALYLGGAPANVAYHLARLGCRPMLISAAGADFFGDDALRRIAGWGVDTSLVSRALGKKTGIVEVDLSDPSHPKYDIVRDVAWDHIAYSSELILAAAEADALVFGTLALREQPNRDLLDRLLSASRGFKAFDVNLRPPFVDRDLVFQLGRRSDLIKLNDDELAYLIPRDGVLPDRARELSQGTGCPRVCVTCGAKGAGLLIDGDWHWVDSRPVAVKDAIGAGDAFLAALLAGLLSGSESADRLLASAARLAEFVASSTGATPDYEGLDDILRQPGSA